MVSDISGSPTPLPEPVKLVQDVDQESVRISTKAATTRDEYDAQSQLDVLLPFLTTTKNEAHPVPLSGGVTIPPPRINTAMKPRWLFEGLSLPIWLPALLNMPKGVGHPLGL